MGALVFLPSGFGAQQLLVNFADLLNRCFQFLIIGQTTFYISDLFLTETDLADAGAGITDSENRHGMSFTTGAFGAVGAVPDNPWEERAAKDVPGIGERRGEAIAFA